MNKNKRKIEIKIRLNESEYKILREKSGDIVFAKWCRLTLLEKPITEIQKNNVKTIYLNPELLRSINGIAVNVNQIAKQINTSEAIGKNLKRSEILQAILNLLSIESTLKEILNDIKST